MQNIYKLNPHATRIECRSYLPDGLTVTEIQAVATDTAKYIASHADGVNAEIPVLCSNPNGIFIRVILMPKGDIQACQKQVATITKRLDVSGWKQSTAN